MPDIAVQLISYLDILSYFGIFLLIAMSGHVIPIPQDVALISAGYITALGYTSLGPVLIAGMLAPVVSDAFLFYLSHHGSRFAPKPEKYAHTWPYRFAVHHMHNNTIMTVMLMRFVTGFRFMSPVIGAYMSVPVKKYFIANTLSAIVFGPLFILLGYAFHSQITFIIDLLKSFEHLGLALFALVLMALFGYFMKNRYNTSNAQE